jgi:hypothetical protein
MGGLVRSVDRTINGRDVPGKTLTPKISGTSPYWQVKYTDDTGRQRTRPVHVLVLEAHRGPCPPGMEGCHDDDDLNNNNLWNLRWDWPPANREDRRHNSPPAQPRPAKACVRCGGEFTGNGKRCHSCVVAIGVRGAELLRAGTSLEDAATALKYPSVSGLHTLAVKYGGYGQSRSRRVRKRLGRWLAGGDTR